MNKISASAATLVMVGVSGLGCTHRAGLGVLGSKVDAGPSGADAYASSRGDVSADQPDAVDGSADGESDSADNTSIVGACVTADDCLPVLDYRAGFECWWPKAASWDDVGRDSCLIPWKPEANCTTARPPADCPGGPIPVNHSCLVSRCGYSTACTDGKCSIRFASQCDTVDGGTIDCEALQATFANALVAAQQCYVPQSPSVCTASLRDSCGCEVPYDISGPCATALQSAYNDWQNANCPIVDCGKACVAPTSAGATCVPNATGTMGTCAWK